MSTLHQQYMQRALDLARRVMFVPTPNPRVGCVIVKNNQIIAEGCTQAVGHPHAEAMALSDCLAQGHDPAGADVYVTLEPCSHFGRTPPCAHALINAKVKRVFVALLDPNPKVSGQGVAQLKAAGIEVNLGCLHEQALDINIGFVSRMIRRRPWVWSKIAASLDGHTALNNGQSKWITGPEARSDGHYWRARSCAILTGLGTVQADDPTLNVRDYDTPRQPLRIILDSHLKIALDAQILKTSPVLILTANLNHPKRAILESMGIDVRQLSLADGRLDLSHLFELLSDYELNEIHVEAGARLNSSLWSLGYIDELLLYLAPMIIGQGRSMFDFIRLSDLKEATRFSLIEHHALGEDLRIRLRNDHEWKRLLMQE